MNKAYGTVQRGEVKLDEPIEWADGTRVEICSANGDHSLPNCQVSGGVRPAFRAILEARGAGSVPDSFWPLSPEESELIIARMDAAPRVFETDAEYEAFQEFLRTSRAEQKELVRQQWETEEPLF